MPTSFLSRQFPCGRRGEKHKLVPVRGHLGSSVLLALNVVSRPTGLAMVSAARRAASRAGYAWRRKQPGISSAVELLLAAGRFLQLESGWTTTDVLALLAGGSFETNLATQQSCCTCGIERGSQIDAHEEAIIELECVQALMSFGVHGGSGHAVVEFGAWTSWSLQ